MKTNMQNIQQLNFGIGFAYLYILFSFIGWTPLASPQWQQVSLYMMLGIGAVYHLFNMTRIRLVQYYLWYAVMIAFAAFSCIYAVNISAALSGLYSLGVIFAITMAISVLIKTKQDIRKILVCFSLSGLVLFLILSWMNLLMVEERLGEILYGNANSFAMTVMLSLICSMWLAANSRGLERSIYLFALAAQYYMILLSGGRKYIIIPLLFLLVLFILQLDMKRKAKMVAYSLLLLAFIVILFWGIFNVPQFYDAVGWRMEGLIDLLTGKGGMETDIIRQHMIEYGWQFFMEHPLLGHGLNNYRILFGGVFYEYDYSHNNFIELLVNLGLTGFVLYYSFYGYVIYKLWIKPDDETKLRDFFLAFMICLFPLELGSITYDLQLLQVFILLASTFIVLQNEEGG